MKKTSEDSLFDKPVPPKDIEYPELWYQAVEQLRGMDEDINREEIPEADVKKLYKEILEKKEITAGSLDHMIHERLSKELEKKYPKGSSVPSREIDLAIANYNAGAPRPLDMREAWEDISSFLQEDGRRVAFTMSGIREFPKIAPGTRVEAKATSTYAGKKYRGTVVSNPYGDYKTILKVKLDNGSEMFLHAGTLDYIKKISMKVSMKSLAPERIMMADALTAQGGPWWEGRKFKHPETGHMVKYKSLPGAEQKRLHDLMKKKETPEAPAPKAPAKAPAKPDPKVLEQINNKLEAEGVDPQDYQKAVDVLSQTVAGPGLVNIYKKFIFKQPQKPLNEMSNKEIGELRDAVHDLGSGLSDEAEDLEVTIDSYSDLYKQRKVPIIQNLLKKIKSGKYDSKQAPKLWKYYVDDGAKQYTKEFPEMKFSVQDRKDLSIYLAKKFEAQYAMGEYDTFGGKTYGNQEEKYYGKEEPGKKEEPKEKVEKVNGQDVHIYDNGGTTADRYTVVVGNDVFGMSDDANAPNGFNQYMGEKGEFGEGGQNKSFDELGKKISLKDIPEATIKAIQERASGD